MRLLAVNNKTNKTNSEKRVLYFSYIRLQKQHSCPMYWLKICKAWVRSQLRWAWNWLKLNVKSSNVLRIIIHCLSARRDVGLTQGGLIPKKHSLYRALKHSIRQQKLDLNLSKTKQPLPVITNSLKLQISYGFCQLAGAPNDNFQQISVQKTIWDLEFSEHLFKISCLSASPRIFGHLKNGIIAYFKRIFTLKRSPRIFGSLFSGWNFRKGKFWSL